MKKFLIILFLVVIVNASDNLNNYIKGIKYYNLYNTKKHHDIKTIKKAIDFFEKSCSLENSSACIYGGYLNRISKNLNKAKKLYNISCNAKNALGCYNLADIFNKEVYNNNDNTYNFIDTDKIHYKYSNKAINLYKKACKLNFAKSCVKLANHYSLLSNENNITKNKKKYEDKSELFYIKACKLGNNISCISLADFYLTKKINAELVKNIYLTFCNQEEYHNYNSCLIYKTRYMKIYNKNLEDE